MSEERERSPEPAAAGTAAHPTVPPTSPAAPTAALSPTEAMPLRPPVTALSPANHQDGDSSREKLDWGSIEDDDGAFGLSRCTEVATDSSGIRFA